MPEDSEQRQFLFDLWEKSQSNKKMSAIEKQIYKIVEMHPETHSVLSNREVFANHEFDVSEPDPFAHLAFHSIIVEMLSNDTPPGIRSIYDRWVSQVDDKHKVQHEFMSVVFDWLIDSTGNESDDDNDMVMLIKLEEKYYLAFSEQSNGT